MEKQKKDSFQGIVRSFGWIFLGIVTFGNILDALSNSIELITPTVTYVFTVPLIMILIFIQFYKKFSFTWELKDGIKVTVKRIQEMPKLILVGIILLLWFPRIKSLFSDYYASKGDLIEIAIGNSVLKSGCVNDIVYCIPDTLQNFGSLISHIPFYIKNNENHTVENLVLTVKYGSLCNLGVSSRTIQTTLGIKDSTQVKRRFEAFENYCSSYFSIDDINQGGMFILNEPIELIDQIDRKLNNYDTIVVELNCKDHFSTPKLIRIICRVGNYSEVCAFYKYYIVSNVIQHRKETSFFNYLHETIFLKRQMSSIIVPSLMEKKPFSDGKKRFISDGLHDKVYQVSFEPAPYSFLWTPLKGKLKKIFSQ